jgi:predicted transcriptional regulator
MSPRDPPGDDPGYDAIEFLAGSPHRPAIIERLAAGPAAPATLADDLDCSRASVSRHLSGLCDRGWAEKRNGSYRLTRTGRHAWRAYETASESLRCLARYEPLLAALPPLEPPLEPSLLAGGRLAVAEPTTPHAPLDRYVDRLRGAVETERLRCVTPVISGVTWRANERLLDAGTRMEVLAPRRLLEDVDQARERRQPALTVRALPEPPEFGVAVTDGWAYLAGFDDDGQVVASVDADTPAFVDWATRLYERTRADSRPVTRAAATADD